MGIVVTTEAILPNPIAAKDAVIGIHYRRQSFPKKLYVGTRDPRDLSNCVLVSLEHGNVITKDLERKDFIEVNLKVAVRDA